MGRTRRPRTRTSSEITTVTNVQIHQRPDGLSPSCEFEGCHSFEGYKPNAHFLCVRYPRPRGLHTRCFALAKLESFIYMLARKGRSGR